MGLYFGVFSKSYIFASLLKRECIGRLAQLVQSICLTSRGSAVRTRQRPLDNQALTTTVVGAFFFQ